MGGVDIPGFQTKALVITSISSDNLRLIPSDKAEFSFLQDRLTAAWLAHVDERRTTVREVGVQDPDRTHTQSLKITK